MKVNVLFFGATADSAGLREAEMALDENTNAGQALERIFSAFPGLIKNHQPKSLLFAVNQEYAKGDEMIREGDELAVFTAVSGG
ncbi:MAG: MoaD/ThiS family protein [Pyrinomonadaceae bacterium]